MNQIRAKMTDTKTTSTTNSPMKTIVANASSPAPSTAAAMTMTTTTTASTPTFKCVPEDRVRLANDLDVIQDMIDIQTDRLVALRTQCSTSAILTQQEIRSLETKLVRMFSELLIAKARLKERIPAAGGVPNTTCNELKQWLRVVGLSQETSNVCLLRLSTLEQLLEQSNEELKQLLSNNPSYREEEVRRLTKAMQSLRICRQCLSTAGSCSGSGSSSGSGSTGDIDNKDRLTDNLFWDSWDRQHHHRGSVGNIGLTTSPRLLHRLHGKPIKHPHQHQLNSSNSSRQSPSNDFSSSRSVTSITGDELSSMEGSSLTLTLTPSPPGSPITTNTINSLSSIISSSLIGSGGMGSGSLNGTATTTPQRKHSKPFATTPPPIKKHQTMLTTKTLTPTHTIGSYGARDREANQLADISNLPSVLKAKTTMAQQELAINQSQDFNISSAVSGAPLNIHSPPSLVHTVSSCSSNASTISRSQRFNADGVCTDSYYPSAGSDAVLENNNSNVLQVPRSPGTPIVTLGMGHTISHRFKKVFKMASCDLCQKQIFFGFQCKECKYHCHKDCEPNVPPSCGLPREFVDEFRKTLTNFKGSSANTSPNLSVVSKSRSTAIARRNKSSASTASSVSAAISQHENGSPNSSRTSSSPSSPALFALQNQSNTCTLPGVITGNSMTGSGSGSSNLMSSSGGGNSSTSSNFLSTPSIYLKNPSQFNFPDVTITSNCSPATSGGGGAVVGTGPPGSLNTQTLYSSQHNNTNECDFNETPASVGQDQKDSGSVDSASKCNASNNTGSGIGNGGQAVTMATKTDEKNTSPSTLSNTITVTSSNCNSVSMTAHHAPASAQKSSSSGTSISISLASTGTGSFYPRKLSSAGVDKRAPFSELSDTRKSNDSDKTVSLSGSTSASTDSDRTPIRLDSTEDGDSGNWPRQNSLSLKEWDIPYGDLKILEPIGKGRFGTVHRAQWHGDVAVKLLKGDYLDDERMLEAFKLEVANFKKTRHENLVLFMGACMNPPYLAIVTSLCKGNTLFTYIHIRRDKFTINKTTLVAQQISQGMGYLHARGIFHKDLRTKNIFLENGKVIITDFGLFSSTKLLYCDLGLGVPQGWLCYLAPELMRALMPEKPTDEILPFSCASDVYSFGTVWYELLCGEFPFKSHPPESVIWQVGRGMKQTLANLQTSRDVKDILMLCWSYQSDDRPDFSKLMKLLERLPKKRLARSPSHPVQLSRSAESVF